ncbi:MAG TPA: zinc metallopeptidase [Thermoleophilia bacterium]|nr:zinc metallopeptidase [Thermoleophilia bacterium]HQH22443.1 zinc metallopeptidase [Thermoleophilia bacterium]HQJ98430.1 zinc metallopeptidase [Thermoleophilia bacterium]
MLGYYLFFLLVPMVLGLVVQSWLKSTFTRNAKIAVGSGLSGAEVARRILDRHGLSDVPVVPSNASALSDHYDPRKRTVSLSRPVFEGRSVAATAVAAHEVGHAIQHATGYAPMKARTAIWPLAAFSSQTWIYFLLAGFFITNLSGTLFTIALVLYAFAVLFQIATLPVEFNASHRAKEQVAALGLVTPAEQEGVSKTLTAAAMTYVAGALAALLQLLYLFLLARD